MPFDFDAAVSVPLCMQPGLRRMAPDVAQLTRNIAPLRAALFDSQRRARVHDALASMSESRLEYHGLGPVRDRLLQRLAGPAHE